MRRNVKPSAILDYYKNINHFRWHKKSFCFTNWKLSLILVARRDGVNGSKNGLLTPSPWSTLARQTWSCQILCFLRLFRWYGENTVLLWFRRPFFPFRCDSTAKTKFTLDSAVLFPHFDSVVRRKQNFLFISPFVLPRSPMKATISRISAYFVAFPHQNNQ